MKKEKYMNQNKILITGASGKLGQLVVETLIQKGEKNFIVTTRNPEKLMSLTKQGIEVRAADFTDSRTLKEAFRGADRLLLISTDAIGSRIEQHKNAIVAAKNAGVQHIIYTSWPDPEKSVAAVSAEHLATEKLIKESGMKYTILRNYAYAENLLMSLPNALEMGAYYGVAGDGKVAYVTRHDCAQAAVGALLSNENVNSTLNISGAKAYSYSEVMNLVEEVTGKKVPYIDLTEKDFKSALVKSGLPEQFASLLVSFDLSYKNRDLEGISTAFEKLVGKKPTDLKEFLRTALK